MQAANVALTYSGSGIVWSTRTKSTTLIACPLRQDLQDAQVCPTATAYWRVPIDCLHFQNVRFACFVKGFRTKFCTLYKLFKKLHACGKWPCSWQAITAFTRVHSWVELFTIRWWLQQNFCWSSLPWAGKLRPGSPDARTYACHSTFWSEHLRLSKMHLRKKCDAKIPQTEKTKTPHPAKTENSSRNTGCRFWIPKKTETTRKVPIAVSRYRRAYAK